MLAFRYGQGTDYFAYNYIFNSFDNINDAILNPNNIHGEIGFRILCAIFKGQFTVFVFLVSSFEIYMLHRCIKIFSNNRILSLLLFFPTLYLTYYFSAIRQGIVLAVFLGILLDIMIKKEWRKYYFYSAILIFIHSSALILFLIPFIKKIKIEHIYIGLFVSFFLGLFMITDIGKIFLSYLPVNSYVSAKGININFFALVERVCSFSMIMLLYSKCIDSLKKDMNYLFFLKLYIIGFIMYIIFIGYPLISSRIMIYFKSIEIIIYPMLFNQKNKFKSIGILFVITLSIVMFYKNINGYIEEGNYNSNIQVSNYPYISVFNKEDIWNYRSYTIYNVLID